MKNNIALIIALALLMTACGALKKTTTSLPDSTTTSQTTTQPTDIYDVVIATLGDWQTLQTGGNIKLSAGSNFSSSVQVRMVRDQAIFISLRPMLGIEVGKLIITADSLYAVDKIHKRYIAEKVSILTSGIPVTVSDVQDIFLGRPFVIGKGTLNERLKSAMTASFKGNNTSLDIVPAGSTTAAYQVKYSDVKKTAAGNIAHGIDINATIDKKKMAFALDYKNIEWNGNVKIDRNIPSGYSQMSAKDLFSMFAN